MLRVVEPLIPAREAPPVAGVRREFTLLAGGKAPRLGGVRADFDAAAGSAAPALFVVPPLASSLTGGDRAPLVGGVDVRAKDETPRSNTAAIAAALSVLAHAALLAWSITNIHPDEALAKGGDMDPIVIEGVSVVLVDQLPSQASQLVEAKAIDETEQAREVADDAAKVDDVPPTPVPPTDVATLTEAEIQQPAADTIAQASDAPAAAMTAAAVTPVEEAPSADVNAAPSVEAAKPLEAETKVALADDTPAAPAQADPSLSPSAAETKEPATVDTAIVSPALDATAQPVDAEASSKVEELPTEVLAKEVPPDTAPATDLYLDSIAKDDAVAEHAPADEAVKPVDPPETEVTAVADAEPVAPLEEKTAPIPDAEPETKLAPKPKKVAAVRSMPSKDQQASVAEKAAKGPLFGTAGAGGKSEAERGRANASSYRAQASAHLRRYRSYPAGAQDVAGTVWVSFTVNAQGQVAGVRLKRSSGYAVLDRAAVGMVKRASPFPPLPANLPQKSLSLDAPVRFER